MGARILIVAAVAALGGACGSVRSMTQGDRETASRRVSEKAKGTVVTEGELSQMDQDRTFICETEPKVGSHIPRFQCRSLRRVQREREVATGFAERPTTLQTGMSAERGGGAFDGASLVATNGSKVIVKEEHPAPDRALPAPDQDPRFPPL